MPAREWKPCRSVCCGGSEKWRNCWAHTTENIFSLFPLPTQKRCNKRLYNRQEALFSGSAPGRPRNPLLDHLVTASLSTTCTSTAKTYTNDGPPSKRRTEEGSHNSSEAAVDTNEWVQCGGVIHTNYDRKILATGQKLTDKHINFAQTLLRLQFPKLNGLQSTLYQSRSQGLTTNGNVLQVLHSRGDHWIVATTIRCNPGEVRVFDSVYATLDDGTYETVQRMFGGRTSFQVTTMNVPKQQGGTDCGVFAIAACTCIAFGGDPS